VSCDSVLHQGEDLYGLYTLSPGQEGQFDHEASSDHFSA